MHVQPSQPARQPSPPDQLGMIVFTRLGGRKIAEHAYLVSKSDYLLIFFQYNGSCVGIYFTILHSKTATNAFLRRVFVPLRKVFFGIDLKMQKHEEVFLEKVRILVLLGKGSLPYR